MTSPWPEFVDIDGANGQNIIGSPVSGDVVYKQWNYVRGRPALYLSSDEIEARVSCYVAGGHDDVIAGQLRRRRAVGLYGPAGSGRETTAIAIMRRLCPDLPIRRFALGDEDQQEVSEGKPRGYLIRFAREDETSLSSCAEKVLNSGGYLVAMAETSTPIENFAWVPIEPPPALDVFRRWVTFRRLPRWADWDRAKVLLDDHLPSDARRLADLAVRAARVGGDLAQQQNEVERAYLRWDDELRDWFRKHDNPLERILLIAAVTIRDGVDEAFVYDAAAKLAESLDPERNGAGLAWCPVTAIREMLGADSDGERITFRRLGYAEAALRHAFADYPLARPELFDWLAALPSAVGDGAPDAGLAVAGTFAEIAADYGATDRITSAALDWGRTDQPDLAYKVLSATCLHPRVGGGIRSALYDWSRSPRLAVTMKLVLARTCEILGQTLPAVALTRLKHLATWGGPQVIDQVIDSALAIAGLGHHGLVLDAALDWCAETRQAVLPSQAHQRRRRAGAMLFLRLAERADVIERRCVVGWRAVLDFRDHRDLDHAALARVFGQWLNVALTQPSLCGTVVAAFVSAGSPRLTPDVNGVWPARPDRSVAAFVIVLTDEWSATDRANPARAVLADGIAIPLTHPWWRRLFRVLRARMRRAGRGTETR